MTSYPHSPGPTGPAGPNPAGPNWYGTPGAAGAPAPVHGLGGTHPVPHYAHQPQFSLPHRWRYKPRRAAFWESKALRAGALITVLALCGLAILAIVRQQTGTEGFLVGLALAVLPVPLLVCTFLWIDRVEPQPWRNLVFAFAWGACAATLIAIFANSFATHILATTFTATPSQANSWGATFAAPPVEETCKGTAVLLLFLFRRRDFTGIVDGVVVAGITATGFAFTENILYLGSAFGEDQQLGSHGLPSTTIATFFIRVIMSPFAHPLFTSMTGIGFGISAMSRRGHVRRWLAPIGGWCLAMTMHGIWNGSSSLGALGFIAVYVAFMCPVFGLLVWLAIRSRSNELKTIRAQLPVYAMAGWLNPLEPLALSSMRARKLARDLARRARGAADARTVREYQAFATSLAFLRARAARGAAGSDFTIREQELLHHLWQRKALAQPVLVQAAYAIRPPMPPQWPGPYAPPPQQQPPYGPYRP
ncbi:PrsW family glutamic-type intramembrane protease [Streptomyces sp. RB6PN25]|uniref:PrsW family glutamic-type intramembrane protease n=1 Tax=Streptomyces humicola TaxID=2953240 RepID=A0ABT1Q4V5_9ACTN|nr:PrsW family glutamic-type intramembrane protease [Streptomyces humicola]MCQ4084963.1 PrsW family glutamic-type intramembrane protease [Streptomyces humicola]